ncbi:hypothetical protein ONE63_003526 [Megalurothrips usitatus]|uniref:Uncharacterized protein n=1 Tax=Megalurothrips usitatus TaxID=439358 RepID=A0AAV7X430_9NEOP|nr:hypothetical protein ONE63_003526 [Megalurothrips usitatus]
MGKLRDPQPGMPSTSRSAQLLVNFEFLVSEAALKRVSISNKYSLGCRADVMDPQMAKVKKMKWIFKTCKRLGSLENRLMSHIHEMQTFVRNLNKNKQCAPIQNADGISLQALQRNDDKLNIQQLSEALSELRQQHKRSIEVLKAKEEEIAGLTHQQDDHLLKYEEQQKANIELEKLYKRAQDKLKCQNEKISDLTSDLNSNKLKYEKLNDSYLELKAKFQNNLKKRKLSLRGASSQGSSGASSQSRMTTCSQKKYIDDSDN